MMSMNESSDGGKSIEELHNLLENLEANHGEILTRDHIKQDIKILKYTVEDCIKGSPEAAEYLQAHAKDILEDVQSKLGLDLDEQTRLLSETQQNATNFTGGKIDRISKAAAEASAAQAILEPVLKEIKDC